MPDDHDGSRRAPPRPTTAPASAPRPTASTSRSIDFDAAPKQCIDPAKTYTATIETTEGTVVVELDTERTPITTNNFVALARYGYFDGTDLFRTEAEHRHHPGRLAPHPGQHATPAPATPSPTRAARSPPRTTRPASSPWPTRGPDSAGGQFFLVSPAKAAATWATRPQLGDSAGSYAVFGQATEGLDVLQAIADLESTPARGAPSKQVTIESVTIAET